MTKFLMRSLAALMLSAAPFAALADHHESAHATSAMIGDLQLSGSFIFETPPNARNAGGFVTIDNDGGDDHLIGASSDASDRVEFHMMRMDGDVMRMRELSDGIAIPAGEQVELAPGGLHLMFIGLAEGLSAGDEVNVSLTFDQAGTIELNVPVKARTMSRTPSEDHGDGHGGMRH